MGNIKLISSKGKKAQPRKRKARRARAKTALTIFFIVLTGLVVLAFSLGFYVSGLETVFPNVWADGIKLSGMTLEEATRTLISEGYESIADGVSATVIFPNGGGFTIVGEDVGFSLDAGEAATAAFGFGRDGSFFANTVSYARTLFSKTELRDLSSAQIDTSFIRDTVEEHTKRFNDELVKGMHDIDEVSITIVKGTRVEPADTDSVFNLTVDTLKRALEEHTHLTVYYIPEPSDDEDIDLMLLYESISVEPVSSVYDPETFGATESVMGVTFDFDEAQYKLDNAAVGDTIVIPLLSIEPDYTSEYIESLLFRDVLAETSSRITGTSNRVNNIRLSTAAVNGTPEEPTLLNPGDVFSFNETVGQRTAARGYREAGAFISGRLVDQVGGGICQTSSTIYNTVLHANLEIVERRNHGLTVAYLPLGQDATVDWGSIDFRFRNNTEFPIRLEAEISGSTLTVRLIGTKFDDNYIVVRYEEISRTPFRVIERVDDNFAPGQTYVFTPGSQGVVVDTFQYFYDADDNFISRTLVGRSTYRVQDRVIHVAPPQPEEPDEAPDEDADPPDDPTLTPTPTPTPAPEQPDDLPPDDLPPDGPPPDGPPTDGFHEPPMDYIFDEPFHG